MTDIGRPLGGKHAGSASPMTPRFVVVCRRTERGSTPNHTSFASERSSSSRSIASARARYPRERSVRRSRRKLRFPACCVFRGRTPSEQAPEHRRALRSRCLGFTEEVVGGVVRAPERCANLRVGLGRRPSEKAQPTPAELLPMKGLKESALFCARCDRQPTLGPRAAPDRVARPVALELGVRTSWRTDGRRA